MADDNGLIGRLVAGAGGAALLVSVFLTWYSLSLARADALTLSWSAWRAVHVLRFVLLLVGAAVLVSSMARSTVPGNSRALLVLAGGLLAGVLVVYRIQSPPGALDISVGPFHFASPPGTADALSHLLRVHAGAWVALFGSALVMLGGFSQLRSERTAPAEPTPAFPIASASTAPPGSS